MEHGVDLVALGDWMTGQGLGSGPIADVVPLAGGTQNVLLRFVRDGRAYVLRRPPLHPRPNSNETMRREARLLGALAGTVVPHPGLIAACDDESILGAAFYLMEPIDGFNPVTGLPELHRRPESQHRMGLALVEALAELAALDPAERGLADFGKIEGFLERQVPRWQAQLDSYGEMPGWPGAEALGDVAGIAAWLDANRPPFFTPGIMHGDFHMANVMYRHDAPELAAVVDWELATVGDPLIDLGWLLATWPEPGREAMVSVRPWTGFPGAAELVAHYAARSARDLSRIDWYAVFGCYKLGILLEGTHARACAGKAPKATGDTLHARALWLFERAGRWIRDGAPALQHKAAA